MIFGKLINGNLKRYRPPIKADGREIYTNDRTILLQYGWKEVVFTDAPEEEGFYPVAFYEETAEQIIQRWRLEPIEEVE